MLLWELAEILILVALLCGALLYGVLLFLILVALLYGAFPLLPFVVLGIGAFWSSLLLLL